ncbi:hypothetical protein SESBI_10180 [Sesbania bispinosa]|nr:hypothetical protein SESBI_10180 [Sesbania bispinosa]
MTQEERENSIRKTPYTTIREDTMRRIRLNATTRKGMIHTGNQGIHKEKQPFQVS